MAQRVVLYDDADPDGFVNMEFGADAVTWIKCYCPHCHGEVRIDYKFMVSPAVKVAKED